MNNQRSGGILLHPTSLPGSYGIGDIGPQAHQWINFLAQSGCTLWQVLPLGPTGYGDSPYQSFSAFAGNPYLISPELLLSEGLLQREDLAGKPDFPENRVDYGDVIPWKVSILNRAFERFMDMPDAPIHKEMVAFQAANASWLEDFSLFMAIKEEQGGGSWSDWPRPLRLRQPGAIEQARSKLRREIQCQAFRQFLFYRQWASLHLHARRQGIRIIGDIPIFVAHDSADVWANPELFFLDDEGKPSLVAGVPPDYFSATGQLWGNPLYRWDMHAATGYSWWLERFRAVLNMVDIVRLDHFRGFAAYWEIPGGASTAETGRWVKGPGGNFFRAMQNGLGDRSRQPENRLPIIAEDLGIITPDVLELRQAFQLPGMKVLQFAFAADPNDPFLPHNYSPNFVVYTGTHDNDTALGWFRSAPENERKFLLRYLNTCEDEAIWAMIRVMWSSTGMFSLAPMQDFLVLGSEARMNFPGKPGGNWTWRLLPGEASPELSKRIFDLNYLYGREKSLAEKGAAQVTAHP